MTHNVARRTCPTCEGHSSVKDTLEHGSLCATAAEHEEGVSPLQSYLASQAYYPANVHGKIPLYLIFISLDNISE